jgi:hypothetical protein
MEENPFLPGIAHLIPGNNAPEEKAGAFWSSKAGRTLQGMAEPVAGGAQLLAHATGYGTEAADAAANKLHNLYQASRKEAGLTPADWDYFAGAGNMLSPVNLLPGAAIGRVAGAGTTLAGMATRGAAAGAAYGATTPVVGDATKDYASEKATQVGGGALAGAVAGPAAHVVSEAVAPQIAPAARQLVQEGVELTPGQLYGGWAKRLEDVAQSVPFVGSYVREAREQATRSFNRAVGNRALAPIGERIPTAINPGHEMAEYIENRLGLAYGRVHSATQMGIDPQLQSDLLRIGQRYRRLPQDRLNQLQGAIDDAIEIPAQAHGGIMPGDVVHGGASQLRQLSAEAMADRDFNNRQLGRAFNDVHEAMMQSLERQNPGMAAELRAANRGWANYVRIRQASASGPAQAHEGVFSATQLGTATRGMDRTAGRGASARGDALLQDIAEAGRSVLPAKIADSGTPERAATMGIIGGSLAIHPAAAIAAGVIPALYSQTGMRFARAALMRRPQGAGHMANALRQYTPVAGPNAYLAMNRDTNE